MTCIKLLTALAGLALLTACGGASPTVNIGEVNITTTGNTCATQPFGKDCGDAYDDARIKRIEECLIGKAAATPTCELARAEYSCINNPFTAACSDDPDFADYIDEARDMRTTYCQANPGETTFCAAFVSFNNLCRGNNDIFNTQCSTDSAGRSTACIANGIGAGGHAICADILVTPCTSDPFTNSHCDDATDISGIRTNYCGNPATAWHDDCVEATYSGATDARNMACLQYGTDTDAGGNTLCAMRPNVLEACDVESPFAHPVCDEVAGIDGLRTTFCRIPANAFTTGCEQDTHGQVDSARDRACLMNLPTATGCEERDGFKSICAGNPRLSLNPGCIKLPNFRALLSDFCDMGSNSLFGECGTTPADVCPDNPFNPSVVSQTGTIDCLADMDYAPARRTACATGDEVMRCDTAEIAPEVCKASGADANPFAAFCATTTNIGGGNIADIRQTALTDCTTIANTPLCMRAMGAIAILNTDCVLAENTFTDRCDYTEYLPARMDYCNNQANTWNVLCDGETIPDTTATRDAACLADKTADMGHTGSDTRCGMRAGVIAACPVSDPFADVGCDNVADIDSGFRTTYCQKSINAWNPRCMDGTHGTVASFRTIACLESPVNDLADPLCATDTGAEGACGLNPFDSANPGCANLMRFQEIVVNFCGMNQSNSKCGVKTSTWVRSFGEGKAPPTRLTATTPATERQRQFLTGLATGLDETGTEATILDYQKFTLTLDSAMYSGEALGGDGDASDGVAAFFDTVDTGIDVYYAGILLNTDLGAPLTQTDGSVTWYGQIQIYRNGSFDVNEDFQLKITFGMKSGVNGSVGSIEGFVKAGNPNGNLHYQLKGTYDAGGVITGTSTRGDFTGSPLVTASPTNGILTGLIGEQGAVGVFLQANTGSTKDNIEGAASSNGYVGGFVAAPYVPAEDDDADKVTFRDWLRGFDYPLPTSSAVEIARTTSKPHFIRPKTDGTLDLTGVTGTTQHKATRAGDDKDGFAYGVGKIVTASTPAGIGHSFVGILPSTDLGAPLTEAIAIAKWLGQFSFGNSATLNDIEFTLTFDGTNSGTIDGMVGFVRFDLDFDGKGIITGDVTYSPSGTNPSTTVARGLIGEEGLVGVFTNINDGNTTGIEFGGFVAQPAPPPPPPVANYDAWLDDFSRTLSTALSTAGATTARDRTRQFLAGRDGETTLDDSLAIRPLANFGLTFKSAMYDGETLDGNSDARDGFAGFTDVVNVQISNANIPTHVIYYAGLLTGTDLGAPLTDTTGSATLFGQIQIARFGAIDTNPNEDFQLKVIFGGASGEAGSVDGFVQSLNAAGKGYHLTGTYDTGGIITGTVTFGTFTGSLAGGNLATTTTPNGILTGLIGKHGAVGVFIAADNIGEVGGSTKEAIIGGSTNANAYAGGFVAAPDSCAAVDNCTANRNAWLKSFEANERPPTTLTATTPATARKRQFLAGEAAALDDTNTINATAFGLTLDSAMYNGAALTTTGDANDGYGLLLDIVGTRENPLPPRNQIPNQWVYYAGILADTDLGAPLIQTSGKFDWNGQIQIIRGGRLVTSTTQDFTLHITLGAVSGIDGSAGSISGFFGRVVAGSSASNNIAHEYRLAGTYYTDGVIDGTVSYSTFVGNDAPTTTPGFLTGLMGEQGAVGVFISGTGTKESIIGTAGASTATTYAGGFVVSGNDPPPVHVPPADTNTNKVTFSDWERDFGEHRPPLTLRATNPASERQRQFLRGGTSGLDTTGAVNIRTTVTANLGTGNTGDGYHYFVDRVATGPFIHVPYAGLLSGTDLGAPLTETEGTAVWNGQLRAHTNLTADVNKPLALTITYGAVAGVEGSLGSIAGAVRTFTTTGFELSGTYDASGVITGKVYLGAGFPNSGPVTRSATDTNGILTGLIGEQGAVGVFFSGGGTKEAITAGIGTDYVGGFVAAYTPPPPSVPSGSSVATHANFKTYYAARTNNRRLLATPTTTDSRFAFLEGTATSLPTDGLAFTVVNTFAPVTVRLKEEATGDNGFAVMYGDTTNGNQPRFRAGLLSGTDLGPALSGTSTATWAGSLHFANFASGGLGRVALPTVTVDFDNGTIKTDAVTVRSDRTVAIDGLFRAGSNNNTLPVGILGGDAIYTDLEVPTRLPLIGLIGTKGAIGVFIGSSDNVGGGFQASPN